MRLRHWILFVGALLLLASVGRADVNRGLLTFLIEANKNNRDQIKSGTGQGNIFYSREYDPDKTTNPVLREKTQSGVARLECQWYWLGDKLRSDLKRLAPKEGEKCLGGVYYQYEQKEAWTPNQDLSYRQFKNYSDAYIRGPIDPSEEFVLQCSSHFNPTLMFDIRNSSLEQWIADIEKQGVPISAIDEDGDVGHKIYTIKMKGSVYGIDYRLEIQIAEDKGFNIISLEDYRSDLGNQPLTYFRAVYDDGGTGGRVFYPSKYHYRLNADSMTEELIVSFDNIQLNVPTNQLDEHLFSLDGLGIKPGTRVYDMRFGEPVELYYGGLPAYVCEGLVKDLIAERMLDIETAIKPSPSATLAGPVANSGQPAPNTTARIIEQKPEWIYTVFGIVALLSVIGVVAGVMKRKRRTKQQTGGC